MDYSSSDSRAKTLTKMQGQAQICLVSIASHAQPASNSRPDCRVILLLRDTCYQCASLKPHQ
eukprot:5356153-Amphidinium_carterae.1